MQNTDRKKRIKAVSTCAALTGLALIFSYVEVLIPFSFGIPGIKPGFANIVVIIALYSLGVKYAVYINLSRILLSALLFGSAYSALYSLAGGFLSLLLMILLKKTGLFSMVGVSMAGGVFHNLGQLTVAMIILGSLKLAFYFPVLLLSGMLTGIINGFIGSLVEKSLKSGAIIR